MNFTGSMERLLMFLFMAVMICHVQACLWVFFCSFNTDEKDETFLSKDYLKLTKGEQYLTSMYFIITTFSTVGYGDISASNPIEQVCCIVAMILGVAAFAYGTSTFTSLL